MDVTDEAVGQVVKLTMDGVEVGARITGACAKQVAVLLYALLRDQKRTKGKIRLSNMLRSGKGLKVFAVKTEDLKQFCSAAKKYGVLYCVLKDKNMNDGLSDIMVREEDAGKVNRIFERFKLATVDMASVKSEVEKEIEKDFGKEAPEKAATEESQQDQFLDELMKKPEQEETQMQNPTKAKNAKSRQSEPTSEPKGKTEKGTSNAPQRPSVRKELKEIKTEQEQARKAAALSKDDVKVQGINLQKNAPMKEPKMQTKER